MTLKLFDTNRYCKPHEKQGDIPKFTRISKDVMKIVWASMIESFLVSLVIFIVSWHFKIKLI